MATLSDLVKDITQGTYFSTLQAKHQANGVPVKSWLGLFNVGYSLSQIVAQFFSDLRGSVKDLARALFLEFASGDGLTLFAKSQFQLERIPSQFATGQMVLSAVAGAPVHVISPGQLTAGTAGPVTSSTRLYSNLTGGTLTPGGTLTLSFVALAPGAESNLPVGSPLDLKTSLVGVSIANPQIGVTGTWLTKQGAPAELDDLLKLRCLDRWGTIGVAGNADAYDFWARATPNGYSSSPVTRVRVHSNRLNGQVAGGAVTVVIAGPAGALAAPDVAAVRDNYESPLPALGIALKKKYPLGTVLAVISATNRTVAVTGVVSIRRRAALTSAEVAAQVTAAVTAYQGTLDIGDYVYPQKVGARIEDANPSAIRDVALAAPAAIVPTGLDEIVTLDITGLTYQLVD